MIAQTLLNPAWRVENLYYIVDKGANRVKFRANSIQKLLNQETARRKIVLKARQFGVSTNELIKQFDYTIWNRNVNTCILAHEQDSIEKLFRIVRRAYDFMDPQFKPELDRGGGSKYELRFPQTNSKIYCDLESRGDTIHWLHISEAAFIKEPARMKSTLQAVPLNGIVTIETTPNGMGNHFYDLWMDPKQPYKKIFYPWFLFNEYQVETSPLALDSYEMELKERVLESWGIELTDEQFAFRRMKQAELGLLFIQEYPEDDQSCFLASGLSAMNLVLIKELLDKAPSPIGGDEHLKIYEKPYAEGVYVIGADCSEGIGADFSAATVIEARTLKQVATLRGQWKPGEYAEKLMDLGKLYTVRAKMPELAVERNNHGHAVILKLDEILRYPHLFVDKDDRIGWLQDRISRPLMIDRFIDAVENKRLTVNDRDTLLECLTLVDNAGKVEADSGKHDDCVIGASIALSRALEHGSLSDLYDNIGSKILV